MKIRLFITACLFVFVSAAQGKSQKEVHTLLSQILENTNAPSLSVAVGKNNQLITAVAVGLADKEKNIAATTDTQYRTGSVSKVVGTTAFMTLVEKGQVKLDDKIRSYLSYLPASYSPITLKHLLTHTSGVRHYRFGEYGTNIHYPTLEDATKVFRDSSLEFQPGTGYQYTTYGINLIQGVIEKTSNQPLEAFLNVTLFNKAAMTGTELEISGRKPSTYATGYRAYFDRPVAEIDVSNKYIGGGMRTTPKDLVKMLGAIQSGKIINEETRDLMFSVPFTKAASERALGWRVYQYKNYQGVGHGGAINGFESFVLHLFEPQLTVAVMVNKDDYDYTSSTLYKVADLFLPPDP